MDADLLYQISLTLVPNIGLVQAKALAQHFGNAADIFRAKESQLMRIEGMGETRARSIRRFRDFKKAEEEIRFVEKYQVMPLFITHKNYPQRLLNCYDSPTLLYFKGNADLNASRIISIVGTRTPTAYGRQLAETFIETLSDKDTLIISGLAYGIDALAHTHALQYSLPTVGVLAHGLDQVYPPKHSGLAKEMIKAHGGLLTEFPSRTSPDRHNFPSRNRIVAGISDATIVIETGVKGGSMITAELANSYNRDVFAFPGRVTDPKSEGCNELIRNNKAVLLTKAQDLIEIMNWDMATAAKQTNLQKKIFIELNSEEKKILELFQEKNSMHIDEINFRSGLSNSVVAAAILTMELQNIIFAKPGKIYSLQ